MLKIVTHYAENLYKKVVNQLAIVSNQNIITCMFFGTRDHVFGYSLLPVNYPAIICILVDENNINYLFLEYF